MGDEFDKLSEQMQRFRELIEQQRDKLKNVKPLCALCDETEVITPGKICTSCKTAFKAFKAILVEEKKLV